MQGTRISKWASLRQRLPGRNRGRAGTRPLAPARGRWLVVGAALAVALALLVGFVVYPWGVARAVRAKLAALETRTHRKIVVGDIAVSWGRVRLRHVIVRGARDGDLPLVRIDQLDLTHARWAALRGVLRDAELTLGGVALALVRDAAGQDNLSDLLAPGEAGAPAGASGSARAVTQVHANAITVVAEDRRQGLRFELGPSEATWSPTRGLVASLRGASLRTETGQSAKAALLEVVRPPGLAPRVTVHEGAVSPWAGLALTGIAGTLSPNGDGRLALAVTGGYGGVNEQLWSARGDVDLVNQRGVLDLTAEKFQLDRLAPILRDAPLLDYQQTTIRGALHLEFGPDGGNFAGSFGLTDLSLGHPMLADRDIHGLSLEGEIAGTLAHQARTLSLTRGDFTARGIPIRITGEVALAGGLEASPPALPNAVPTQLSVLPRIGGAASPPGSVPVGQPGVRHAPRVNVRVQIPEVACQQVLVALGEELAPYLAGYRLKGNFAADVHAAIDWRDVEATVLEGRVGLDACRVVSRPTDSPERLLEEFEHYVELGTDEWISFVVGPSNPDFVPLAAISPYVPASIMTTEDSAFMHHRGFIPSEFRSALVHNLKAGSFRYGASSITMQLVKNALLYRKKTLARKLQELFLTWDIEHVLEKERILEVYLNVIEYGPGIYGIGPAAAHYFGKAAADLTPTEAAFFSSILPAPKPRYKQYCEGTLSKWTEGKISRILALMLKRNRLTQAEYDLAMVTPLVFVKDETETVEDCLARQAKAVKNARPTNPMAK